MKDSRRKRCTVCGGEASAQARFCPSCGSSLSVISETSDSRGWIPRLLHHLSPNDRTGREAFLQTVVIIYGLLILIGFVGVRAYFTANPFAPIDAVAVMYPLLALYYLLVLPLILFQAIKRFHDFDRPWWHVLTLLIPIWHLYEIFKLVFVRGDEGPNWFGEMTPQHSSTLRRNSWLLTGALSVFVIGTLWWSSGTEAAIYDLVTGDCFVSATSIEAGLSDIDVVSCSGNWDYKVSYTFVVDRSGAYPEVNYFEQLVFDRCPSADWYLYPLREAWQLGDRTINCLQNY